MAPLQGRVLPLADHPRRQRAVYFSRGELNRLLGLYSRQVMSGEWRDYAIDHRPGRALFSIFRHSFDRALFTIIKCAPGSERQGDFIVMSGPEKLRQAATLDDALKAFDGHLRLVRA